MALWGVGQHRAAMEQARVGDWHIHEKELWVLVWREGYRCRWARVMLKQEKDEDWNPVEP